MTARAYYTHGRPKHNPYFHFFVKSYRGAENSLNTAYREKIREWNQVRGEEVRKGSQSAPSLDPSYKTNVAQQVISEKSVSIYSTAYLAMTDSTMARKSPVTEEYPAAYPPQPLHYTSPQR